MYEPVQTTPFSFGYKLKSRLWNLVNSTLFRWSPFFLRKYRVALVRMFGGKIDWTSSLSAKATIIAPWNLTMGYQSSLGDYAYALCHNKVVIGSKSCIGRGVCLLTGSHDINSCHFEMITDPIEIGDCVWVATNSTILKGVKISEGAVIGAESLVTDDVEPWTVVGGNPAKFIKKRVIKDA